MKPKLSALVVCGRKDGLGDVCIVLEALSIKILRARNCKEAAIRLARTPSPDMVLTDIFLPDGDWKNILNFAELPGESVPVIVVSPSGDIELYIEVLELGGLDFMTGSFTVPEMIHVIRGAMHRAIDPRLAQATPAQLLKTGTLDPRRPGAHSLPTLPQHPSLYDEGDYFGPTRMKGESR
jgi:DNA-binding response OmpR family regulator